MNKHQCWSFICQQGLQNILCWSNFPIVMYLIYIILISMIAVKPKKEAFVDITLGFI